MAINHHPKAGQILLCDFSQGFKEPEMIKKRPVLVITPPFSERPNLVTVLALSTKQPNKIMNYHYKIPKNSMPQIDKYQSSETWLKGDMIYTVGFHRLERIKLGKRDKNTGKRVYFDNKLGREQMREIYSCALYGLNLGRLSVHL